MQLAIGRDHPIFEPTGECLSTDKSKKNRRKSLPYFFLRRWALVSIPQLWIDDSFLRAAGQPITQMARKPLRGQRRVIHRLAAVMRTYHDIGQSPEWMFRRQRLGGEHVQARAGQSARLQRLQERRFLSDRAARNIDV